jgi:diketogulonate reductase-like aldo/keto reductase
VGAAIKKSGVPRAQIFLTTKIWNNNHHPEDVVSSVEKSLQDLGTDYVDLLLSVMATFLRSNPYTDDLSGFIIQSPSLAATNCSP